MIVYVSYGVSSMSSSFKVNKFMVLVLSPKLPNFIVPLPFMERIQYKVIFLAYKALGHGVTASHVTHYIVIFCLLETYRVSNPIGVIGVNLSDKNCLLCTLIFAIIAVMRYYVPQVM